MLRFLLHGWKWLYLMFRLVLFIICLMPAWPKMIWYYLCSGRVLTRRYGPRQRNSLDLYLPPAEAVAAAAPDGLPVVVFLSGGAWTIGYKCWGMLLGRRLAENGILAITVDYRCVGVAAVLFGSFFLI